MAGAGFAANDMVIVTAEWFRPRDFFLPLLFLTFKGGGGDGPNNGLSKAKELSSMTTVVHTTSIELKLTNRTSVLKAESGV